MPKRPTQDDGEEGPLRTCLVTREKGERSGMIRFVLSPEGEVTADIRNRLPGRGVWIKTSRSTISEAVRRKVFDRGFRGPARIANDLPGEVERLLEADALQMLGLANKAGIVVTGFGKVEDELASGTAAIVVHAADAAQDGIRKLGQAARRAGHLPQRVNLFGSARLGLALGRPHVIHAALKAGPAGEAFLAKCHRLQAFCEQETADENGHGLGIGADE